MLFVFFFVLTLTSAEQKLNFNYQRVEQKLNVSCVVQEANSLNFSHVTSMVISREIAGKYEILASGAPGDGVSVTNQIASADVTGQVSWNAQSSSFLNIQWSTADQSLSGNYKCELNGLTFQNIPQALNQVMFVSVADTEPTMTATPGTIEPGLTRNLSVRCSISNLNTLKISQVLSIEMFVLRDNVDQILAAATAFKPAETKPGNENAVVDGYVGASNKPQYIQVSWEHPTLQHGGAYLCDIMAINSSNLPVSYSRTINVTSRESTRDELVDKIHDLEAMYDTSVSAHLECQSELKNSSENLTHLENEHLSTLSTLDTVNSTKWSLSQSLESTCNLASNLLVLTSQLMVNVTDQNVTEFFDNSSSAILKLCKRESADVSCDFERDLCGFVQSRDDDFDWTRISGPTSSTGTGPATDHTLGTVNGHYVYVETSNVVQGQRARLQSPLINGSLMRATCVTFYYNMYGTDIGTLNVFIKEKGMTTTSETLLWTLHGNQGSSWLFSKLRVAPTSSNYVIVFEVITLSGYMGDVALDDININPSCV
ncbi:uncharacterized protein LOC131948858 [Physella acuta]|uniref:uncharacterized protein LOC131948858 n=1 Tax=Physella acuta TaxID=109671 RepID=UPI0027DC9F6E|nr:uncharacterized protein LOC131948858 [Physella acuta]